MLYHAQRAVVPSSLVLPMRRALTLTALAVALASPSVASAQSGGDVARADALFNAAKALLESGQYGDACAKFAESNRLVPGLGVTLYLADCYERIGRLASAWSEFRSAEGLARERNDKRADVARARAQAIEPKLDRLTIAVGPTVPRAGLQILLDGASVPPEEWGIAMASDPGDRVVVVTAPGHPPRTISARLGPDNPTAVVRVDSLDEPPAAPVPSSAPLLDPATHSVVSATGRHSRVPPRRVHVGPGGHAALDWRRSRGGGSRRAGDRRRVRIECQVQAGFIECRSLRSR